MASPSLILPVETQVRELDAKLLLACVAAERGVPSYIGFQNQIRSKITRFPPSIFIAKGFASRKARMLHIIRRLGHQVFAWDEEGLVHHPPYVYHDRRMSKESLACLSGLFAWGPDYAELVEQCPFYDGTPIYQTGNPRIDLLGPALRPYFQSTVDALRKKYGRFVLINSSFGTANFAVSELSDRQKGTAETVKASAAYWQGQLAFRSQVFGAFRDMVGRLADQFPETSVVLRPHPAENIDSWHDYAAGHDNLHIATKGNVVPWLIACELMIHNGCMTAVEGTLLGKPALSFQPMTSEDYDRHLPNALSTRCSDLEELFSNTAALLNGRETEGGGDEHRELLDRFMRRDEQQLSADRIVDVVQEAFEASDWDRQRNSQYWTAWGTAQGRAFFKWIRSMRSDDIYSTWHQRQQFPELQEAQVQDRIAKLQSALSRFDGVVARRVDSDVFLVSKGH